MDAADAGAASGLVNTFHQLGSALGLGVLIADLLIVLAMLVPVSFAARRRATSGLSNPAALRCAE